MWSGTPSQNLFKMENENARATTRNNNEDTKKLSISSSPVKTRQGPRIELSRNTTTEILLSHGSKMTKMHLKERQSPVRLMLMLILPLAKSMMTAMMFESQLHLWIGHSAWSRFVLILVQAGLDLPFVSDSCIHAHWHGQRLHVLQLLCLTPVLTTLIYIQRYAEEYYLTLSS